MNNDIQSSDLTGRGAAASGRRWITYRDSSLPTPHIQLIFDECTVPPALRTALDRLGARVSIRSLDKAASSGVSPSADVCVILPGSRDMPDMLDRILADASERACGTLVIPDPAATYEQNTTSVSTDNVTENRSELPGLRPTVELRSASMSVDELTGRLKALCEIRHPLRKMREELMCLRQRDAELASGAQDFSEQLQLASQIQNDLLPEPIREIGPLSIATLYVPAEYVSGDIYDISPLDEDHVGISIADATGHGVPAALLTFFIRNSFRGKDVVDGSYRIIEPDELLSRVNRELYHTNLTQCQFITGLYAVYHCSTRTVRWARAGLPYPILLRPGNEPRQFRSDGALLGALDEQNFEVAEQMLQPGDILLFYTDGLEALLLSNGQRNKADGLLAAPWLEQLPADGAEAALANIRERAANLSSHDWPRDDVTVIALTMNA